MSDGGSFKSISLFGGLKEIALKIGTDLKHGFPDEESIANSLKRFGNN